jgi:hypothetical protein
MLMLIIFPLSMSVEAELVQLGALVGIEDSGGAGYKSLLQGRQAETSLHPSVPLCRRVTCR